MTVAQPNLLLVLKNSIPNAGINVAPNDSANCGGASSVPRESRTKSWLRLAKRL
jgi:hypothetical protein